MKKEIVKASGKVFIIPNSAPLASELMVKPKEAYEDAKKMLAASGIEQRYKDDAILVEVWIVSEDLNTENLNCHNGRYVGEDGKRHIIDGVGPYIPYEIFEGKREGDVVDVVYPSTMSRMDGVELNLQLTLAQKEYRYRNFGDFEDVLRKVTGSARAKLR